jgi:co-chaperonin GroES (HSP10)
MAAPTIDNIMLPTHTILVLPDAPDATTGVVFRRSKMGGGRFQGMNGSAVPIPESSHVLFVKEMATEVNVNGVEYLAMYERAIVGLIKD